MIYDQAYFHLRMHRNRLAAEFCAPETCFEGWAPRGRGGGKRGGGQWGKERKEKWWTPHIFERWLRRWHRTEKLVSIRIPTTRRRSNVLFALLIRSWTLSLLSGAMSTNAIFCLLTVVAGTNHSLQTITDGNHRRTCTFHNDVFVRLTPATA